MIKIWMLCAMAVVLVQLPSEGSAKCCRALVGGVSGGIGPKGVSGGATLRCGDCTTPTPCCATRPCNFFCCSCRGNCRGGCRVKRSPSSPFELVTVEEATGSATDILEEADTDGDGRLSLAEVHAHVAGNGLPVYRAKRSFMDLDTDNDGFLSLQEIDPSEEY